MEVRDRGATDVRCDRSNFRPCRRAAPAAADASASVSIKAKNGHLLDQRQGRRRAARSDGSARPQAWLPDPRHRADALHRVTGTIDWKEKDGACRVANADGTLSITYTYPQVTGGRCPPTSQRRWARFMAGVRKHEETHGRIARQMVGAAEKSVCRLLPTSNDPRLPQDAGRAQEAHRRDLRQIRSAAGRVRPGRARRGRQRRTAGDVARQGQVNCEWRLGIASRQVRLPAREQATLARYSLFNAVAVSAFSSGAAPPSSENSTSTGRWSEPTASSVFADRITMSPLAKTWSIGRPA